MTTANIYNLSDRVFRLLQIRHSEEIKSAYPATGGHPLYFHNWHVCAGEPQALAMADRFREEDRKARMLTDRWYRDAEHRTHVARGFKPRWCERCSGKRQTCW